MDNTLQVEVFKGRSTNLCHHADGSAAGHAGVPAPAVLHARVDGAAQRQLVRHWDALVAARLQVLQWQNAGVLA